MAVETMQEGGSTDFHMSTRTWYQAFLSILKETANVSAACRAAQIDRSTAYKAREVDQEFAVFWKEAEEEAADKLEAEAWRRAVEGFERPVFQGGEQVGVIREYSDQLMQTLLKGHKPTKFRENRHVEHSGSMSINQLRDQIQDRSKQSLDRDKDTDPALTGIVQADS